MPTIPDWSRNVNRFREIRSSPRESSLPFSAKKSHGTKTRVKISSASASVCKKSYPFLRPCTKNLAARFVLLRPVLLPAKRQKKKPLERGLARSIEIEDDAQDDEHRRREEKERPEVHYALGQRRAMTFTSLASYSFTSGSSSSSERTFTRSLKTSEEMTTPLPASVSTSAPTRGTRLFLST